MVPLFKWKGVFSCFLTFSFRSTFLNRNPRKQNWASLSLPNDKITLRKCNTPGFEPLFCISDFSAASPTGTGSIWGEALFNQSAKCYSLFSLHALTGRAIFRWALKIEYWPAISIICSVHLRLLSGSLYNPNWPFTLGGGSRKYVRL